MKLVYEAEKCIGSGDCAKVAPGWFKIVDKKAILINGKDVGNGKVELVINSKYEDKAKESCVVCPVSCIKLEN